MNYDDIDIYNIPNKWNVGEVLTYVGDVNPIHGGAWFDFSNVEHGYVDAVRVYFDEDCEGIAIEHIILMYDKDSIRELIESDCCGRPKGRAHIADSLMWYGKYDPDDGWNGYQSGWCTVYPDEESFEAGLIDHLF